MFCSKLRVRLNVLEMCLHAMNYALLHFPKYIEPTQSPSYFLSLFLQMQ